MLQQNEIVNIPIGLAVYRDLITRYPDRPHSVIENVISDFLERTSEDLPHLQKVNGRGVMWELLFLPEKTQLRTKHINKYKYAEITNDAIVYGSHSFPSVSKAINYMRGETQNNAWRVTEVLLPNSDLWARAEKLRHR